MEGGGHGRHVQCGPGRGCSVRGGAFRWLAKSRLGLEQRFDTCVGDESLGTCAALVMMRLGIATRAAPGSGLAGGCGHERWGGDVVFRQTKLWVVTPY